MSKSYDFEGKNVEQAIQKASEALNIAPDKINHEVLAYGSSGIFGLVGVKKAKIKVFVSESNRQANKAAPEQPVEPPVSEPPAVASLPDFEEPPAVASLPDSEEPPAFDENMATAATDALQKIVDGITTDAQVKFTPKKDKLFFEILGGESGVLIGKRGQTLEAIQYLLEKMINKKSTNRVRVVVDVEDYLEKRKTNLQQMASRMAEKAIRIKKPVTIGQMNAHDRRIVHIHLKDESGVRTQSIGDGYFRKLMIFPKKQAVQKGQNSKKL